MIADYIKTVRELARQTWDNRAVTWELARRDLHKKYKGAALGVFWAAAHPITYVLIYWFAVVVGLRGGRSGFGDFPFILWLIPGMFAWRVISDTLSAAGKSVRSNSRLVTRLVFPTITIPQFSVISLFLVHICLMAGVFVLFLVLGHSPTWYWLQLLYFMLASFLFCTIAATFLSALTVYSRDLVQFVRTITRALFWFSPIIWPMSNIEGVLSKLLKLNPIAYLVEGYRWCFIFGKWFWEAPGWTLYFWSFLFVFGMITAFVWGKMSRNFADVL